MVLYPLSFGPAVMLAQRRLVSTDTVEMVYSPVETAALIVPGAAPLLHWYVGLWESLTPMP